MNEASQIIHFPFTGDDFRVDDREDTLAEPVAHQPGFARLLIMKKISA